MWRLQLQKQSTIWKRSSADNDELNALIDLKQKFSNILEARWARNMAEETSRQGSTLMVFTTVTIVFVSHSISQYRTFSKRKF